MPCIYCGVNENLSDSDIIPDFMTNGKILNPNVCKTEHNSKFSDNFESCVFKKLSFLLNHMYIKSSKAKDKYPEYDEIFSFDEVEYEVRRIRNEQEIFGREVLRNKEGTSFFGNPNKLKEIAKSKGENAEINLIDLNNQEITIKNELCYEIFFETQMFRLVAKIAYEWYCLRNDVKEAYAEFSGIIDYITKGSVDTSDKRVTIVKDSEVLRILDKYEDDGGHVLIVYLDKDYGVSAVVDLLSVCIYNVKICDSVPSFCKNNMLMQHITIDGSGNRKDDCLCKKDYNGLFDVLIETATNTGVKEYVDLAPGFQICAIGNLPSGKDSEKMRMATTGLELMSYFEKGLVGIAEPDNEIVNHVIKRLKIFCRRTLYIQKQCKDLSRNMM